MERNPCWEANNLSTGQ